MLFRSDLGRTFGRFTAVDRITFQVAAGEVFGFLGANGAGKTTAIRMLIGLLEPSSGTARVAGHDVYTESEAIKRSIGYMSQRFSLYEDLTPRENIRLYGGIYGLSLKQIRQRTDRVLQRLDLARVADEQVRSLPLGWRQKLAFSVAVIHEPRIVFLDEPTSGLDPIVQQVFYEILHERRADGATVFLSSHVLPEVQHVADRVGLIREGRLLLVDAVEAIRTRAFTRVEATFAAAPPSETFAGIDHVRELSRSGDVVSLSLEGPIDPLLKVLARYTVVALDVHEADLEDVPDEAKQKLAFHSVDTLEDVLKLALVDDSASKQLHVV